MMKPTRHCAPLHSRAAVPGTASSSVLRRKTPHHDHNTEL
jgi:hypothetical protein